MSWWMSATPEAFTAQAQAHRFASVNGLSRVKPQPVKARWKLEPVTACLTCHQPLTANQQRHGLARCDRCRKKQPGIVARRTV